MKRVKITLEAIADRKNLIVALQKAAKGKRHRNEVIAFFTDVDTHLNQLSSDILNAKMPYGIFRRFYIHDPKKRLIHAACFEDRIFHHAVMNFAGGVIDKAMLPSSYACRREMGVHKCVQTVQVNMRRFSWYCKIDIDGYFAAIDQQILLNILMTRFKGEGFSLQLKRMVQCYQTEKGKGLPIGSLSSQFFANYYLDGLDRLLDNNRDVKIHVRYMDDIVWWCNSKQNVKQVLKHVDDYLQNQRLLKIKPNIQILPSKNGISYCGYRVTKGVMRMSRRRKKRYQQRRHYWEAQYLSGVITAQQLQVRYDAVHAITQDTQSNSWRRQNLMIHPPPLI